MRTRRLLAFLFLAAGVASGACSQDPVTPRAGGEIVGAIPPDFHALDQNPASPRAGQTVSPRDYLERVSGWYFGHAT